MDLKWMDGYTQWEGRNLENLTKTSGHEWSPRFSPDGEKLIYAFYEPSNDNYDIFKSFLDVFRLKYNRIKIIH